MGLTSPALPYLLAGLSTVCLALILAGWPRLARRGASRIAMRVASLCVLQTLVLGLIFVVVNRAGEFYASWSDLFGSVNGGASVVAARAGTVSTRQALVLTGQSAVRVPGSTVAEGSLQDVTLYGQLSGLSTAAHVYLPAGYRPAAARRYPVLVEISDAAADSGSPYAPERLAQSAATEIAAHRMPPMIIVMLPAGPTASDRGCLNLPPPARSADSAEGAILGETFFAQDIPQIVESGYRASDKARDWALLADQSGGYCALHLALDDAFAYSVAVVPPADYSRAPGGDGALNSQAFRQQDDLVWQLGHLPMQPVSVLFAGSGPGSAASGVQPFLTLARRPMRVSMTQLDAGSWPLASVLDWIGTAVTSQARRG